MIRIQGDQRKPQRGVRNSTETFLVYLPLTHERIRFLTPAHSRVRFNAVVYFVGLFPLGPEVVLRTTILGILYLPGSKTEKK